MMHVSAMSLRINSKCVAAPMHYLRGSSSGLMYLMFHGPVAVRRTTLSSWFHR